MIAVIVATREAPELHGLDKDIPLPLIPLCDRPFLQHIIENLLHRDIRQFEIILSHLPQPVETYFGDGVRWGCQIRYHLTAPHQDPYSVVHRLMSTSTDTMLLGAADSLPDFESGIIPIADGGEACTEPLLLVRPSRENGGDAAWTGWALLPPSPASLQLLKQPDSKTVRRVMTERELSIRSGEELLRSQREVLEEKFDHIHISGQQIRPGIWISRSVSIQMSAKLEAPVYIGANCRIGSQAHLGPSAVVGCNSIVGAHSTVINSMVCPGTYIGEALELDHVIVNQHHLVDLKVGTSFAAPEPFLFGSLTDHGLVLRLRSCFDRLIAMVLLAILAPVVALAAAALVCFKRAMLVREEFVPLPRAVHQLNWRQSQLLRVEWNGLRAQTKMARLLFEFTPGLMAVIQGRLALVGTKARAAAAIEQLPDDWRALYLKTKAGLVTEADVVFGLRHTEDELYSCEAYYGAMESFSHDLKLLRRYLSDFGGARVRTASPTPSRYPTTAL